MKSLRIELDYSLTRKLSTLALLPEMDIEATYYQLRDKLQTNENKRLFDYFYREWIMLVSN